MSGPRETDGPGGAHRRLDAELVRRGMAPSRSQAQAAIAAGKVSVAGRVETKAGRLVAANALIEAESAHPWVSRGGVKLAAALDAFGVEVAGRACLDIGASTGGFSDVLLSRGARAVTAVDVGRGQLHPRIAADGRVRALEQTDARGLTLDMIGMAPDLMVVDVSFIGLAKAIGPALHLAAAGADLVALFKPQFEVGPAHVGRGGIVSDQAATEAASQTFADWLAAEGWRVLDWIESPIAGGDGNRERLVHARRA